MLFGGKPKAEEVEPAQLGALLNSCFEGKLGPLRSRTEAISRDLRTARDRFLSACDKFGRIDPEPYTEDLYSVNVNFIRSQKALYVESLRRLAGELVLESPGWANAYEECEALAAHAGVVASEILKANATFRLVVHCYPNYLVELKKSFSSIERLTGLLRGELERRSVEREEYGAVREGISRLSGYGRELDEMGLMLEGLRQGASAAGGPSDKGQRDLAQELAAKRKELAAAQAQASELRNRIGLLVAPLERPAKKFDHLSARKRPLHAFIDDPVGTLRDDAAYAEFGELVRQLIEKVNAGAVDVKNKGETVRAASALLGPEIRLAMASFGSVRHRRSDLEGEVRGLERTLDSLKEGKTASESAAQRIATLERRIAEIGKAREAERAAVEGLFSEAYRKRISIKGRRPGLP